MSYAIQNDGKSWRAINSQADVNLDETFSENMPVAIEMSNADTVRADRDARLAPCDWTQLSDAPLTAAEKTAWKAYRQALRDITEQAGFPDAVEWPVTP